MLNLKKNKRMKNQIKISVTFAFLLIANFSAFATNSFDLKLNEENFVVLELKENTDQLVGCAGGSIVGLDAVGIDQNLVTFGSGLTLSLGYSFIAGGVELTYRSGRKSSIGFSFDPSNGFLRGSTYVYCNDPVVSARMSIQVGRIGVLGSLCNLGYTRGFGDGLCPAAPADSCGDLPFNAGQSGPCFDDLEDLDPGFDTGG